MTQTTTHPIEGQALDALSRHLRVESIRLADRAGSGHPTSSMSAADLVAVLIANHLHFDPDHPDDLRNDRLVFSKGHASPLLYSALATMGMLTDDELAGYRTRGAVLEGHPTPRVPGVDVATGSLGLGLPMAVGMALAADRLDGSPASVWVLCGDSEMSEGSMWEAIEHAGWLVLPNLVAVVDVNRLGQRGPTRHGWDLTPYRRRFEAGGWDVVEVDGHDLAEIDRGYRTARAADRPVAVLARTHKGSGASETDDEPGMHGKPLSDPEAAIEELGGRSSIEVVPPRPSAASDGRRGPIPRDRSPDAVSPSWPKGEKVATRDAFGAALTAEARRQPEIVALDAEVADSTRLQTFADEFADRFFEVFIAEQLMVAMGVGLQVTGWRAVVSTFAAFLTRAHDVIRMASVGGADLCLVGSHAGVSIGPDGPSQMGLEDLAMMRAIHGSTVVQPCDANQTVALLSAVLDQPGCAYLRTMRGETPVIYDGDETFAIGGSRVVRSSPDDEITLVGSGVTVHEALAAADRLADEGFSARVVDAYSVKPIDGDGIAEATAATGCLVVVEDHRRAGGLGEAVATALLERETTPRFRHLAVDVMPGSATPDEQRRDAGIDADAICGAARELLSSNW